MAMVKAMRSVATDLEISERLAELSAERRVEEKRRGVRHVVLMDRETGEILDGTPVLTKRRVPHHYREWTAMNCEEVMQLAADKTLRPESLRVFLYLSGAMAFENWIPICQADLARALNIGTQNISRAMCDLVRRGLIEKGIGAGGNGRLKQYRLSPKTAWKGQARNLTKLMRERAVEAGKVAKMRAHVAETAGEMPAAETATWRQTDLEECIAECVTNMRRAA